MKAWSLVLCLLLVPASLWSFELFPSRLEFTKVQGFDFTAQNSYTVSNYQPDSASDTYCALVTQFTKPYLTGAWSQIELFNAAGGILNQLNPKERTREAFGRDIDGDGNNELVVSFACDTSAGVLVYDWPNLNLVSRYELKERDYRWRGTPTWETAVNPGPMIRRPGDAAPLLLLMVSAGKGKMPKGIVALDATKGKEVWRYWIAGSLEKITVLDAPGMEQPLIIFGTYSADNGSYWNETNDTTSAYLCALDFDGHEVWRWEKPGTFVGLDDSYPFMDGTGPSPKLFTLYRSVGTTTAAESLFCVDAARGTIQRRAVVEFGTAASHARPWNLSRDGQHQFLVWNETGGIGVYDESLKLVRHDQRYRRALAEEDIDHDGMLELAVETRDGGITLLDDDFSRLGSIPVNPASTTIGFQRSRGNAFPYVVVFAKDEIARFAITKTPLYWAQVTLRIVSLLLLGTLAVWIVIWGARARIAAIRARQEKERTQAWAAMASRLAHDVRTPLAVLKLSGQNLELELESALGSVPEHLRHYFDTFRVETDRTENVARGLLKFTRQAPPALEEVDLGMLIRGTVERHPHSPEVDVRTEIDPDLPRAVVDHQQMISLVENLISNSLKAMKGKGELTVTLRRAQELQRKRARDMFELEISDTGRGIPPQDLPRILEPYFSHSEGGTGLGLAIVKKIVEDHHGTISIQSTVGVGTAVTIRIPVGQENRDE